MAEIALQGAYKGIQARLSAVGYVTRVSVVKANTPFPHVVQFWQGGGEANAIKQQDADLMIGVKCVSDKLAEAMQGAAAISAALNDKGESESPTDYVYGGVDWRILSITEGDTIYLADDVSDSEIEYHVGAQYRLAMVRR